MENNIAIFILLGTFITMLIIRIPIMISLVVSSILTAVYLEMPLLIISQRMVKGVESFSLLAIPFFIIAGEIMGEGGISKQLIKFANVFVGRFRGGLAQVNVLASMFFGGISGSAVADLSSQAPIILPAMKEEGYDEDFSVAVSVASSTQGIVIPPSHNMIIYSTAAGGLSVGALFLGGLIPGILMGLAQMVIVYILSKKRGYPKEKPLSLRESVRAITKSIPALFTVVIIMGGTLSGIFTATESAAFAALYAFILTFLVYRAVPLAKLKVILYKTIKTLSMVMGLIAAASGFGYLMAYLQVPLKVANMLLAISSNKIILILLINLMILSLGVIMDVAPIIIIITPILLPIVKQIGISPIQFGVMMLVNLAIGLCTPPVGASLFVGCSIGNIKIEQASKALLPFYLVMIIALLLITFIPELTLYLPRVLNMI